MIRQDDRQQPRLSVDSENGRKVDRCSDRKSGESEKERKEEENNNNNHMKHKKPRDRKHTLPSHSCEQKNGN